MSLFEKQDKMKIAGTVALVTGGSRGIGKACVEKLLSLGAKVSLIYTHNCIYVTYGVRLLVKQWQFSVKCSYMYKGSDVDIFVFKDCPFLLISTSFSSYPRRTIFVKKCI